ncbi:pyridoxamine 5'-phosphate oxidase family protein [Anoxybacteroides amylolyticum]|uniref:Pyridoxamine 5'-phosphate oxidase family protein n=1 Tax=Anoxybacteroides amylolyticum TaxID=294699 RepID=A0A160F4A9_9BACL|nr:pyridoxamine 5'-phosphate oxidase family protein [Anoxybacillus amylolyticus]ANB61228.1 pyridoxamine 5'-phosphate oxidase family protein [Anoxybacillus amylolyticus]
MGSVEKVSTLSRDLMTFLSGEKLVLLTTMEAERNIPNVAAISWVKSVNEKTIRFAVSTNSRIVSNIRSNPHVVFTVIGLGTVYSIHATSAVVEDAMSSVSLKLAKIEATVEAVFDSMFWGSQITTEPAYEKTYNVDKAKKLDEEVYQALLR